MSAKKKAAKNGKLTKTAFVLGLPDTMRPKEVVEKAKEQGIDLTEKHVSAIRSLERAKKARQSPAAKKAAPAGAPAAKGGRRRGRPPGRPKKTAAPAAAPARRPVGEGGEQQFKTLVLDLGLRRASELLEDVRATLASLA
jgi:hypothetical protein